MSGTEKSEEVRDSKEKTLSPKESSSSGSAKRKRRAEVASVIQHGRSKRRRRDSRSRSHSQERGIKRHKSKRKEERDYKLDEIFNWVRNSQVRRRDSRSSSRYSGRSTSSRRRIRSRSRSSDRQRSYVSRKSHDISFDSRSAKRAVSHTRSASKDKNSDNGDLLTRRLQAMREEGAPKPVTGPPLSEELAPVVDVCIQKSDFAKAMKTCEKYPKPSNLIHLSIPELPKDSSQTVEQKLVKNDEKLQNDQKCTSAIIGIMGQALDVVLKLRDSVPELIKVGDMLLDGVQVAGFLHQDLTNMRIRGFKQTVNPSYAGVFSAKPDEPDMLLGKTPIGEQIKTVEELNKLKAKLKKPETSSSQSKKDFWKGGDYRRSREYRQRPRRRDDRRSMYFSPKGKQRRFQQERTYQRNQPQEEHKHPQGARKN